MILVTKEFLDLYKALEKIYPASNPFRMKQTFKELLHHVLSSTGINEFNDSTGIIHIYIRFHKLIEAAHLIAIRMDAEQPKPNNLKWKNRNEIEKRYTEQTSKH